MSRLHGLSSLPAEMSLFVTWGRVRLREAMSNGLDHRSSKSAQLPVHSPFVSMCQLVHLQCVSADFEDARQKYADAMNTLGYQADLAYNMALCYFKDKKFVPALKHIGELETQKRRSRSRHIHHIVGHQSGVYCTEEEYWGCEGYTPYCCPLL